jgi:hypothetical protein
VATVLQNCNTTLQINDSAAIKLRFSECDGSSGQNGAFENTVGPKGGGCAKSPVDILRFGPANQVERGVRSGNQGAVSYEEKVGVRIVETVQSTHDAIGEVNRAIGTIGSGGESQASDFDLHGRR